MSYEWEMRGVWKPQNRDTPVTDDEAIAILQRIAWGAGGPDRDDVISACGKAITALLKASRATERKTNDDRIRQKSDVWRSGADNPKIAELIHEYRENHKTNADKYIRDATDEELAHLIAGDWCELINCPDLVCDGQCEERVLAWLKKEVEDDG